MGVSKGMVSQWENNIVTPPMDRLIELHKHLDFSFDWLLTGDISMASKIEQQLSVQQRRVWYQVGIRLLNQTKEPMVSNNVIYLQIQLKFNFEEPL